MMFLKKLYWNFISTLVQKANFFVICSIVVTNTEHFCLTLPPVSPKDVGGRGSGVTDWAGDPSAQAVARLWGGGAGRACLE